MFECYPADELTFQIFRLHTRLTHHQTGLDHVEEYSLDQETYPEHYVPHRYRIFFPPNNNEYIFPDNYFFPDKFFFSPDNNEYIFPGFLTTIVLFFPDNDEMFPGIFSPTFYLFLANHYVFPTTVVVCLRNTCMVWHRRRKHCCCKRMCGKISFSHFPHSEGFVVDV